MEVLRQDIPPVTPPLPPADTHARIWFWNQAGAQTFICPARDAQEHMRRLIAEGAVVWRTEVREA